MKDFFKVFLLALVIYLFSWAAVYFTGVNRHLIQSEDTLPALFLPAAIINDKTLYLDEYYNMMLERYPHPDDKNYTEGLTPFYLRKIGFSGHNGTREIRKVNALTMLIDYEGEFDQHYVSAFPIITGALAVPIYLVPLKAGVPVTWDNLAILSHVASAVIVALSGAFLYLLLRDGFNLDRKKSQLLAFTYLFATINYALISQALWQHGTVQLLTILSLIFLFTFINTNDKNSAPAYMNLFASGFFVSFAFLSRPTAALFIPLLLILIYQGTYKKPTTFVKGLVAYFAGFVPALLFFIWYNEMYYLSIFNQGYADHVMTSWLSSLPEGFLGLWVSPSKGILVYSPVLLFSFVGAYIALKDAFKNKTWDMNLKYLIFAVIVIVHTLVLGKWKHWYGGWSFGYRMASDILPFLILLLVPYVANELYKKTRVFYLILFWLSILIQVSGVIFFDGVWHAAYDRGFQDTRWLWSIKDSEFAFNFRRVLVKLGLLERACPTCQPYVARCGTLELLRKSP
jgi:hypothetical protein